MNRIIAAFNVFNEVTTLLPAMESVAPYVDKIIIVDGAYAKFPHTGNKGASDDGTLELVKRLQNEWNGKEIKIIEAPGAPWENEMVKRTAYFDAVDEGDWVFIIDADERLAFGGAALQQLNAMHEIRPFNAGICIFRFFEQGGKGSYGTVTRVYRKLPGTHYGNTHAHLMHAEPDANRWNQLHLPIVVEHPFKIRPDERNRQREEYYASGNMR